MEKGFTLLEFVVTISLTLGLLSMLLTTIVDTGKSVKKHNLEKESLESLFFTIDALKTDIQNCGSYLQAIRDKLALIETDQKTYLKLSFGITCEALRNSSAERSRIVNIERNSLFSRGKEVVLIGKSGFMINQVSDFTSDGVILKTPLESDFSEGDEIVVIKTVEYRFFPGEQCLKRKVNKGSFQPMLQKVTDFFCSHLPESNAVLYRLEINRKQQVRNFLYLSNLVP